MKKVSVAFHISYSSPYDKAAYLPVLTELGEHLERCYCQGFKRGYVPEEEPIEKMITTKIPARVNRFIYKPLCKILCLPDGTAYLLANSLFDLIVTFLLKKDNSDSILVRGYMPRTIKKAKKMGKKVIVMADMSEPNQQYEHYIREKNLYLIKRSVSYGYESFRDLYAFSLKQADYIITLTELSTSTYLAAGYDSQKLKTIPLTASMFSENTFDSNKKKKAFICTANHSLLKGTHRLLLAWKKANIKDVPLIVIGKIYDDMKEFIKKYGPFENVFFEGFRGDLDTYYNEFDAVGILLSFSEAAPRTTTEMMKKGFPMIVSSIATCDLIENHKTGFVIDPMDEKQIIEKLLWFSEDWNRTHLMRDEILEVINKRTLCDYGSEIAKFLISV